MTPELLLAHFNRISDAPEAIPRLRQLVLELAVRGKLVDLDPQDEPATMLLNRIQAEKDKRIKAGQMKKQSSLPQVRPDENCFDIPKTWHWVRLGTITQILMGQSPPGESYNKTGEGIPLINGPVEFTEGPFGKTFINQYTTAPTNLCEEGDLLLCVRGSTTGRTNVAGFRACIGRGVAAIRPFFADQYVRLFIWRQRASIIAMGRGIAFPSVSRQQIEELPVPLPPLGEQHRIAAKVDELMALCDRLEAGRVERELRRNKLVSASHYNLINGENAEGFRKHASFYIGHLPRLTARPDQIKQLRRTILNFALRGQLLAQDPADEPASELLKRIQVEKASLVKDGVIKKFDSIHASPDSALPFPLPSGWTCSNLHSICVSVTDGDHLPPPKADNGIPFLVIGNVRSQTLNFAGCRHVATEYYNALDAIRRPRKNDILYTLVGSYGIPVVVKDDRPFCVQRHIGILRPSARIDVAFLSRVLESRWVLDQATACATGIAQKTVPLAGLRRILIPLPPLAEQQRIVTKVNEMIGLCDRLENQLTATQAETSRLLESILHHSLMDIHYAKTGTEKKSAVPNG